MTDSPSIWCGTYAKYNAGNLHGKWFDLEDFTNKDDFMDACRELHKDEHDPEFMFQDFSNFPRRLYGESHIDDKLWDWLELDEDDREMFEVYLDEVNQDGTFENAQEAFDGKHASESDWAREALNDQGFFHEAPDIFETYFDFEAYARDLRLGGDMCFVRHQGDVWAFRGNV